MVKMVKIQKNIAACRSPTSRLEFNIKTNISKTADAIYILSASAGPHIFPTALPTSLSTSWSSNKVHCQHPWRILILLSPYNSFYIITISLILTNLLYSKRYGFKYGGIVFVNILDPTQASWLQTLLYYKISRRITGTTAFGSERIWDPAQVLTIPMPTRIKI